MGLFRVTQFYSLPSLSLLPQRHRFDCMTDECMGKVSQIHFPVANVTDRQTKKIEKHNSYCGRSSVEEAVLKRTSCG